MEPARRFELQIFRFGGGRSFRLSYAGTNTGTPTATRTLIAGLGNPCPIPLDDGRKIGVPGESRTLVDWFTASLLNRSNTGTMTKWWSLSALPRPPPECKSGALLNELRPQRKMERPGTLEVPSAGWKPTALPLKLQSRTGAHHRNRTGCLTLTKRVLFHNELGGRTMEPRV